MTVQCAECKGFYCKLGKPEASPDHCPMRGDFPDFQDLYPEGPTRSILAQSARVEAKGYCRWTRLREVGEFAHLMEYQKIGLAYCPDMRNEAERVGARLRSFGLEPIIPPFSLAEKPISQARALQERDTDLNLICGMCPAHEVMFLGSAHAPTASLIARDTRLHHNPAAALYTSRSYLKAELFGHWPREDRVSFLGRDEETLNRLACRPAGPPPLPRSRVAEAMDLAHGLGAQHIGLSFCVGFKEEAKTLARLLETNGFQVSSVCCKTGAVPKEEIGISDAEKVRPGTTEMVCNPVAQAELLNREGVQFTISLGQCVGHDAATLQHLQAPAICLVAKDRVLAHNTVAALHLDPQPGAFHPIGFVENGFPFGTPGDTLRASESRIILSPEFIQGLEGLELESRVLVVFSFHRSQDWELKQHPRGDKDRPKRGVFALRSPRRPNGVGVTEVELLGIRENILTIRGLDAVDGTPVLDLKPA